MSNFINEELKKSMPEGQWLRLEEGKIRKLECVSAEVIDNRFQPGTKVIKYHFINIEDGEEKILCSQSKRLLRAFDSAGIGEGDWIELSREGERYDIRYTVKKIDKKKEASDKPEELSKKEIKELGLT